MSPSAKNGAAVAITRSAVEAALDLAYVAADGAGLRDEDRKKARELVALLEEIGRLLGRSAKRETFTLVDAAAGKSYVGVLAAKLVLEPRGRRGEIIAIERESDRVEKSELAARRLAITTPFACRAADVADATAWPEGASLVVALHACGEAADHTIDRAIASGARSLLLVPCCTDHRSRGAALAERQARSLGIPRQAAVRRRFVQAIVDAERTLRLEAAGYETETVEFVAPTVTPHNVLFRARKVGEPARMRDAAARYSRICTSSPPVALDGPETSPLPDPE